MLSVPLNFSMKSIGQCFPPSKIALYSKSSGMLRNNTVIVIQMAAELVKQFYKLGLTTVNIPRHGNCIRFDPVTAFPGMLALCTMYTMLVVL